MTAPTQEDATGNTAAGPFPWDRGVVLKPMHLGELLRCWAEHDPEAVAFRELTEAGGQTTANVIRRKEVLADLRRVRAIVAEQGVEVGARVLVPSQTSYLSTLVEWATWTLGAISVGIHPGTGEEGIRHVLDDAGPSLVVTTAGAAAQEVIEVLRADDRAIPRLALTRASLRDGAPGASTGDDDLGAQAGHDPATLAATLVYTSGTTGDPKGVVHTHDSLAYSGTLAVAGCGDVRGRAHRLVPVLPQSHIAGKLQVCLFPLLSEVVVCFVDTDVPWEHAVATVRPTYMMLPPRFYEKLVAALDTDVAAAPTWRRSVHRVGSGIGARLVRSAWRKAGASRMHRGLLAGLNRVLSKVSLTQVGLDALEVAYISSAPIPPAVVARMQAWGIDMRVAYGISETGGRVIGHQGPFEPADDLGEIVPLPGTDVERADTGELWVRGRSVFQGYWGRPEATEASMARDWFRTGDVVEVLPNGRFRMLGRESDRATTSGGKTINLARVEEVLGTSPFVRHVVAIAHGRRFVCALVSIDADVVAAELGHRPSSEPEDLHASLSRDERCRTLVEADLRDRGAALSAYERPKALVFTDRPLSQGSGELTATGKVNRTKAEEHFSSALDALYEARS